MPLCDPPFSVVVDEGDVHWGQRQVHDERGVSMNILAVASDGEIVDRGVSVDHSQIDTSACCRTGGKRERPC